jgi:beta-lactamase class A
MLDRNVHHVSAPGSINLSDFTNYPDAHDSVERRRDLCEERMVMTTRREICTYAAFLVAGTCVGSRSRIAFSKDGSIASLAADVRRLEAESGGRLGVAVLDTRTGARAGHRADERFPMCSTFKFLAAAAILKRVEAGQESLDRRIVFAPADIVVNSLVTRERAGAGGMSLGELCEAAMTFSDNTAGNLLLAALGGPAGLTAFARSLGDQITRLDRIEPELNEALPDDPRDTTTPAAMSANLRLLVLGNALSESSREQLTAWLLGNKTGGTRLRARLPQGWRVGDKTGVGERGTNNDVGLLWPPGREAIVVSAYLTGTSAPVEKRNATIAAVGEAVATALGR